MNGKGSNPRPLSISTKEFAERWEETFGKNNDEAKKLRELREKFMHGFTIREDPRLANDDWMIVQPKIR